MEQNGQKELYPVDIALCIDGTGSMGDIIGDAKKQALNFYPDFKKAMEEKEKSVGNLRVRLIVFRDLKIDEPMELTDFYNLPDQEAEFADRVNLIEAKGGGDEPESALEALIEATKSNWTALQSAARQRHVIVLWTDASAHIEALADFTAAWNKMNANYKRLVIFAPERSPWKEFEDNVDNLVFFPSQAGKGLGDIDYKVIMDNIAASV